MKKYQVFFLALVILTSGCILDEKVPVLHVKVTMGDEINGTMVINGIEAYAGEAPKLQAPKYSPPERFPAIYVDIIQKSIILSHQTGVNYNGPGVYELTIGLQNEVNRSLPVAVMVQGVDNQSETAAQEGLRFNWSTEVQSVNFK